MGTPLPISLLDFSPMRDGETASDSLRRSVELARQAESLDYRRFWFAEHHNVPRLTNAGVNALLTRVSAAPMAVIEEGPQ
jgi:alkanesulfonate monooxygenase SsuD/methylene tetrahydromethanopterin reductase-like flavin-dependent oxidoreductase (luciferase family)